MAPPGPGGGGGGGGGGEGGESRGNERGFDQSFAMAVRGKYSGFALYRLKGP